MAFLLLTPGNTLRFAHQASQIKPLKKGHSLIKSLLTWQTHHTESQMQRADRAQCSVKDGRY
jgi:hypothetical protein